MMNRTLRCYTWTEFLHLTSNEVQKEGKAQRKESCARSPAILLCNSTLPLERVQAPGDFSPATHTSSFWYAVTAINWVSGKEWLVIIRCGPPTLTMWIRGSYLCREFSMIWEERDRAGEQGQLSTAGEGEAANPTRTYRAVYRNPMHIRGVAYRNPIHIYRADEP